MSDVNSIPDPELIRRVIVGLRRLPRTAHANTEPLWSVVSDTFCLGSTYAMQLCRRFNFDPDIQVRP